MCNLFSRQLVVRQTQNCTFLSFSHYHCYWLLFSQKQVVFSQIWIQVIRCKIRFHIDKMYVLFCSSWNMQHKYFLTWASALCGSLPSQQFAMAGMLFFCVWLCIFFRTVGSTPVSAGVQLIFFTWGGKSTDHEAMYNACLVKKMLQNHVISVTVP